MQEIYSKCTQPRSGINCIVLTGEGGKVLSLWGLGFKFLGLGFSRWVCALVFKAAGASTCILLTGEGGKVIVSLGFGFRIRVWVLGFDFGF